MIRTVAEEGAVDQHLHPPAERVEGEGDRHDEGHEEERALAECRARQPLGADQRAGVRERDEQRHHGVLDRVPDEPVDVEEARAGRRHSRVPRRTAPGSPR